MSLSRSFRVVVLLVLAGCAANQQSPSATARVCGGGVGSSNRQAPIVCVDDSARTLTVSPDPVTLHDVRSDDRRSPVVLHWYTRSGSGDLQVEMEPGCTSDVRCDGNGHCQALSRPGAKGTCKYDVWINGGNHERLDPTVVITTCCG
jgi:hypothetical protein